MIELNPIKEWPDKAEGAPEGQIRLYISNIFVGVCTPENNNSELFKFSTQVDIIDRFIDTVEYRQLEDIKYDINLCLKEFCNKIVKQKISKTK